MKKLALVTMLLVGLSPVAMAQTAGKPMDETQLKQKLQDQGYSGVTLQPAPSSSYAKDMPVYLGTGSKDGKQVHFEIDASTGIAKLVDKP